jgi:hypothetical protein
MLCYCCDSSARVPDPSHHNGQDHRLNGLQGRGRVRFSLTPSALRRNNVSADMDARIFLLLQARKGPIKHASLTLNAQVFGVPAAFRPALC